MSRTISTIYKSLVRAVNDAIDRLSAETGEEVRYWAFESRADEDQIPQCTVLGLDGFSFEENTGLWVIRCGISLSTFEDRNNHEEAEMLDILHELFGHGKKVALRDPTSGTVYSELYVSEFQVMPMGQSEIRNYRTIGLELLRTENI